MSEGYPLADIREEASSSGFISRQASDPTLNNEKRHHEHEHPPHAHHHEPLERRTSRASRVSVDFFDPEGMVQLQRTLTGQGNKNAARPESPESASSYSTGHTLTVDPDDFDLERMIRSIVRRRDKAEIRPRSLGVAFRDLRVQGVGAAASYQPTLGSLLNPLSALEGIKNARHPPLKDILQGFEGVVKPGEMLLVLGSPGAGCSTMLKTLANHREEYHSITGDVHYDSISPSEVKKYFRGGHDVHFPTLTVEQTIEFAARTRTPRARLDQSREVFRKTMTDILITVFGLRHVRNTFVGDAQIRGISGGQRKRVSIAEMLATRACIGCWDNSTRGLDASTALEFVQALRIATDTMRLGTVVSIYQAGESLYEHFDKVCVIYEGRMAYFGPADKAKQYFIDMGYEPANRQTTPDFLVAVTDPGARIPVQGVTGQPRTADEFAQYFKASKLGRENSAEVDEYIAHYHGNSDSAKAYAHSARAEFAKRSGMKNPFMLTIPQQVSAVMRRKVQIIRGNISYVFQGIIMGTVFLRMPEATSAYFSRGGVLFFALLFSALNTMAEIPSLYSQRDIVSRHEKAALYHPFVEMLAHTLVDIPISLGITVVFSIILIFLLFLIVMSLTMKSWFRAIAAAFTSEATAQAFAGISTLALAIYTGYTIPRPSMIGALRWITYINPLRYGFESILTNEFRTLEGTCTSLVPQGPGYENILLENQVCAVVGAVPGQNFVDGARFAELSYGFKFSHTWMNLGISIAFGIGLTIVLMLFAEYNTNSSHATAKETSNARRSVDDMESQAESGIALVDQSPPPPPQTDIFTWQDIVYTVPILEKMIAPFFPTSSSLGAGKTTLLNVLAKRVYSGTVTGDMLVNGQGLPADFQAQTGYVQQMDTHEPPPPFVEALTFSGQASPASLGSLEEKLAYVEKCIDICGLREYAEAAVGSLNVEYKKGLQSPSSLQAKSAWAICSFLRSLADQGQAYLCTIHQPSAELFQVFDRLLLLKKGGETVYFGDVGKNANTLIQYFEHNGGRECKPSENPAEYMLDVIGAGATAKSAQDWYSIWKQSPEALAVSQEIDAIVGEGRQRGAFATSWSVQAFWRDRPTSWPSLAKGTQQGTQNKLFAIFMTSILSQLMVPFIDLRNVYEIASDPVGCTAGPLCSLLRSSLKSLGTFSAHPFSSSPGSGLSGFHNDRAGYTYLMMSVVNPLYYSTIGQAVAAMSPSPEIGALLFSFLFSFVLTFNGVLQPFGQLGWWRWIALGEQDINCSAVELVSINPLLACPARRPEGTWTNPEATSACQFCSTRTTDQFLEASFNIFYSHRWRNVGIMLAFIGFNVFAIYGLTYLFRIRTGSLLPSFKKKN
ncbi:hypothetical protein FA13DRAFT_1756871 [Coprinellus micaceus]|uniref:ABC transporter domain-containing protein n=1 Tax=Coprinellus micaceus TaxID=71717 RepID=A0A4Y7SQV8_COPMI|nr:hypothetical protein FA13DRAFT_1756871 [Coprinellus micaceus]